MVWLGTVTFPTEQDFEDVEYAIMVYDEVVKRSLRAGVSVPVCWVAVKQTDQADHDKLLLCYDIR